MQTARPRENHRCAGVDAHRLVTLAVKISESPRQRFQNVLYTLRVVFPHVRSRIFQVQHYAGRAGIEHLHHEFCVIRRPSHLIPLVRAPRRQLDAPGTHGPDRRWQVGRNFSRVRFRLRVFAPRHERPLPQRQRRVKRGQKIQKPFWEIALRVKVCRSSIDRNDPVGKGQRQERRIRSGGSGCHDARRSFLLRIRTRTGWQTSRAIPCPTKSECSLLNLSLSTR